MQAKTRTSDREHGMAEDAVWSELLSGLNPDNREKYREFPVF
jgi:hypothetical protein